GNRAIRVKGHARVFVDGDIETVGNFDLEVDEGAELELWVAGTIETVGNIRVAAGSGDRPRAFKLFMGGRGSTLVNVGSASFVGAIYAPEVDIEYVGNLDVVGSL